MEKMREEFEAWVKDEFDIDCATMIFGKFDGDSIECYHDKSDSDGAIIVSAMLLSWKASRAALCVEFPVSCDAAGLHCDCEVYEASSVRELLDKVGVSHK